MVSVRYPEVVNIAWVMYGLPFFTFTSFIFACFKSSSIQFFHFNPGQYIFNSLAFGGSVCKYVIYSKFYSMTYLSSIIIIQRRFFYFFIMTLCGLLLEPYGLLGILFCLRRWHGICIYLLT